MLILDRKRRKAAAKDKKMLKSALKQQRELRLAITIDVSTSIPLLIHIYFPISHLVHEEFGPSFAWMGNHAALEAKLQEVGYNGDGDMVVGAVIAPLMLLNNETKDLICLDSTASKRIEFVCLPV